MVLTVAVCGVSMACSRASDKPAAERAAAHVPDASTEPITDAPSDEVVARVLAPWTGDLDAMANRHVVRMLVTFSRTHYFVDRAQQQGIAYDAGKLFEDFLNQRLKTKTVKLHVVFIPVSRDRILTDLAAGRGDIAAAGLTITSERQQLVDFGPPAMTDVGEVVVTAADQPAVASPEQLSGRTVHVRRSSSYFASLSALNDSLKARGRAPVRIRYRQGHVVCPSSDPDLDITTARRRFGAARFEAIFRTWQQRGVQALWAVQTPHLREHLQRGDGRIEFAELPHQYLQLTPLVGRANGVDLFPILRETT